MVMWPANFGSAFKSMQHTWPHRLGWLIGPSYWARPWEGLAYALDNDAYICFRNGIEWNEKEWLKMLDKASKLPLKPLWAIVPDVVGNREKTIQRWHLHKHQLESRGIPKAFAVQDRMEISDVPADADVVFVGGTTAWKWGTVHQWCANFPRVHIGRVRTKRLTLCHHIKAESCDGSGWFRNGQNGRQVRLLHAFMSGWLHHQLDLFQ